MVTSLVVVIVVVGVVAALIAAGRMVLKASQVEAPGTPSAPSAEHAAGMAPVRQQYVALATALNAEMAPVGRTRDISEPPIDGRTYFTAYTAALRKFDRGMRAVPFPASVKPYANALLSDDGRIESGFDRDVANPRCECTLMMDLAALRQKRAADVQRLRVSLGLPPSHSEG